MRTIIVLILLLLSTAASAGKLEPVLVVSPAVHPAGGPLSFSVYLHNAGEPTLSVNLSKTLSCRLESDKGTLEVAARQTPPLVKMPLTLSGGEFVRINFSLTIPAGLTGTLKLRIPSLDDASVLLAVGAPPPAGDTRVKTEPAARKYVDMDAFFSVYQPYLKNISAYEPMYFLVGTDPKDSKFQISLKYRLFNPDGPLSVRYPWLQGLHFAYTQTSFWDLKSASMPFEDTSYKPEMFFRSSNFRTGEGAFKGLFFQTGFQHESNGRGGDNSRSTNFLYAKPIFIFYDETRRFGLQVAPKIWGYVANEEENNPDLPDYRGYFDLELKAGRADSLVLGSNLRWAAEGGSIQLDLTYPLRRFLFGNIDLYLQAQYVNSLAESLIDYKTRNEAFRLGFAIVR